MLLKLRGGLNSFFVTALLGVLIASFAIFGIGSSAFTSGNQQVASVGETPVSTQAFYSRVQNQARTLQAQYGGQMSVQQIISTFRLDQAILGQMLSEAAITEHLRELGMRAGNAELRKELETYEGLVLPDGTLSRELVLQVLQNTGLSRAEFMSEVRRGISQRYLADTLLTENAVPRAYAEALYTWQAELRKATLIDIKADKVTDIPAPTEEELATYFEQNKAAYRTDARRSYNYLLITPQRFMDDIEVSEEQIAAEFEARKSQYVTTESRTIQQASFGDKAAAEAFLLAVKAGGDFVEAAASVTAFTAEEIELGSFGKDVVETDFGSETAEAIFSLEEGGVTEPIESFAGWNVFRVAGITEAKDTPLEEVRDEITASLKEYEAQDRLYQLTDTISEAMLEHSDLAGIAGASNLPLASVTDVNASGTTAEGTTAITSAEEYAILRDAFSKEIGEPADIQDLDPSDSSRGFYMLEVSEIKEPQDQTLEDVRTDVVEAWTAEKRMEKTAELAEAAKARLEAGETAEEIALDIDAVSFDAKNIARTGDSNASLAANIRRLIFDLPKGQIDYERSSDGTGYVIVRVDEVTPGDPVAKPGAVDTLLAQLNSQMGNEIYEQYQRYLGEKYDPSINYGLLETLFTDQNQ